MPNPGNVRSSARLQFKDRRKPERANARIHRREDPANAARIECQKGTGRGECDCAQDDQSATNRGSRLDGRYYQKPTAGDGNRRDKVGADGIAEGHGPSPGRRLQAIAGQGHAKKREGIVSGGARIITAQCGKQRIACADHHMEWQALDPDSQAQPVRVPANRAQLGGAQPPWRKHGDHDRRFEYCDDRHGRG